MVTAHEIFVARGFERFDDLLSFDGGEMVQEHFEVIPAFQIVDQIFDRHTCAFEDGRSAHGLLVDGDDIGK